MMVFTEEQQALADAVIAEQLAAGEPTESVHREGAWRTALTPVAPQRMPAEGVLDLSGDWAVTRWPFKSSEEKLASPKLQDADWERVAQPGRVFTADPELDPEVMEHWDRISLNHIHDEDGAVLRRTVTVPAAWAGKEIFLDCDAIYPAGRVYVNGRLVADHRSGLTPVCCNVTKLVRPGAPVVIAVRLLRKHPYVMMDMPRHSCEFGGMPQPVFLFAKEKCHAEDFYLPAVLDEDLKNGRVEGFVRLRNAAAKKQKGTAALRLYAPGGSFAAAAEFPFALAAGEVCELPLSLPVHAPALWNDEHPALYRAELTLSVPGAAEERYTWRVGFRRLDFRDCRAYLNGNPVKFRGVNHLTGHPQYGLYTPKDWLRRNFELMKLANVNCIRTHFCGPRWLADLCDEMGIYLVQELPVDWGTNYIHNPEWVGPALLRIEGGVCRDRNHPSVMIWAVGNENMPQSDAVAADGWMHLRLYDRFVKTLDPHGITMFPPPGPASKIDGLFELRVGDVADVHYSFRPVERFLRDGKVENPISWEATMETNTREEALARGWSGTWFSTEYCLFSAYPDIIHSPDCCSIIDDVHRDYPKDATQLQVFYDRMRREWGFMRGEESCLGGTYFPWMSSGSSTGLGHPFSWTILSEDCDWGVMTPELLPKPEFWALRNLLCPVWLPDEIEWFEGEDGVSFELWNQYNDINLADCTIRITGRNDTMRWRDVHIDLAPGERKTVFLPFWKGGMKNALARGEDQTNRFWLIDPKGFVSTVKDVTIFSGKQTRTAAGAAYDVSPEPAYINKKK